MTAVGLVPENSLEATRGTAGGNDPWRKKKPPSGFPRCSEFQRQTTNAKILVAAFG